MSNMEGVDGMANAVREIETVDTKRCPPELEGVSLDLVSRPRNVRAEAQRRARARRRTQVKVYSALCWLSLLEFFGVAGGLDCGGPLLPGIIGMVVSLGWFVLFGTLAGIIEW